MSVGGVLARAVVFIEGDTSDLKDAMSEAEHKMKETGDKLDEVGEALLHKVTLPLVALGTLAVHAFAEAEDSIARVDAILEATGGEAGLTSDHLHDLALELQGVTRFSSTATESAAAFLLTFTNIRNVAGENNAVFDRTVKLSQDLASLLGGDLQSAMFMLGRAMDDPGRGMFMLQRRTHALTDEQQKQIKSLMDQGRIFDAQKIILDALDHRIGGLAEKMAATPIGQFKQAWNELETTLEGVGAIIAKVLLPFVKELKELAIAFRNLSPATKTTIVAVGAVAAAIGPLLIAAGMLVKVWAGVMFTFGLTAGSVGLAVTALLALVALTAIVASDWDRLSQNAIALWANIKNAFFTGVDFILSLMEKLPTRLGSILGIATGDLAKTARRELALQMEASLADAGRKMAEIQARMDAAGNSAHAAALKIAEGLGKVPHAAADMLPAVKVMHDLGVALSQTEMLAGLLGDSYDQATEQVGAYEAAIKSLTAIEAEHPGTVNAEQVRTLAARYADLRAQVDAAAKAQQAYTDEMTLAQQAVEATQTPMDIYNHTVQALQDAQAFGVITWDQYIAAVKHAREEMEKATETSHELRQAIHDIVGRATDDFVEFAFGAKKSFSEFVRSALEDLAKLIIKLEVMQLLFPKGGGFLHTLFPRLFAQGGFLPPGQIGIAGEAGPEIIAGGHSGVTVIPAADVHGAGSGGGSPIHVTVQNNIAAADSRDVARLFEENDNLVAASVMRALQRSSALAHGVT